LSRLPEEVDLRAFLALEGDRVEAALQEAPADILPRVPEAYRQALAHGVSSGGKRIRPILCVAAYRSAGGREEGIYALAVSLELIHAYSLMHDDLPCMDDAELRRGEPTTHRLFGEGATMVAGALLIPLAAGADGAVLDALDAYGAAIGLAFQIADDLLDATSTAQDLGKNPSDSDLGKSTYVTLFGVQEAGRRAHSLVEEAVAVLRRSGLQAPELEALARYIVERKR
jgi:geranylgeranyl pyrophosphate synthase